ncbi:hypothetical protein MVI01_28820 [Myxococcus virescens]|uniref:Uncharacterized protein n=1 Tax=Myxococcus virescens TaxID=83456 RepID=A0A511HC13_9BACT|nr:hypothetical protein MVI01_28820 [Myxococcus virescens]
MLAAENGGKAAVDDVLSLGKACAALVAQLLKLNLHLASWEKSERGGRRRSCEAVLTRAGALCSRYRCGISPVSS